jgi:hypothetical protein
VDGCYLDAATREFLRNWNIPYLAAMNTSRFREVWPPLKEKVEKPGDFAYSWSEDTKELAGCTYYAHGTGKKSKKKCILTNLFRWEKHPKEPIKLYDVGEFYKRVMRLDDSLNGYLSSKWYPRRRRLGYIENYDDFTWTALLWNCSAVFHEEWLDAATHEWDACLRELARDLWNYARNEYKDDLAYQRRYW